MTTRALGLRPAGGGGPGAVGTRDRIPGRTNSDRRTHSAAARVGVVVNGASLAVVALLGLANGLDTDGGVSVWRVCAYPLLALVVYLHSRWLEVRGGGWILLGVAAAAVPMGMIVSPESPPASLWESVSGLISVAVVAVLPWLAGRSRRQQAQLVIAGQREVEQLKREREYDAERTRARERARIATDVHDSLGHELALIALRAGALELSPQLSEPNRLAAQELRASAVKATDRLRETIGMLREDAAPMEPADETVADLVERAGSAGMDVTLMIDPPGRPVSGVSTTPSSADPLPPVQPVSDTSDAPSSAEPLPLDQPVANTSDAPSMYPAASPFDPAVPPLPPVVDRAVHRVVREALTNAARHAPGAPVTVRLCRNDTTLDVTITNPVVTTPAQPGAGSGLAGLAERVRLLGGEFTAGPGTSGFAVTARLPIDPDPAR